MPLNTRNELQIISDAREQLSQKGIVSVSPGSTSGALLEIASTQLAGIHRQIESLNNDLYLSTASGNALDRLGVLLGTRRGDSARAYDDFQNVRFQIDPATGETAQSLVKNKANDSITSTSFMNIPPTESDPITVQGFVIKEGTELTTVNGSKYVTTSTIIFSTTDVEEYAPVLAANPGSLYNVPVNGFTAHNIKTYQPELASISDYIMIDNRMPISSGKNIENDESYRFRLQQSILTLQTGNQASMIGAILSVPGIRNATFLPYLRGVGTFTIIIETTYPIVSDGLVRAAQQVANLISSAGNKPIIIRPTYKVITCKIALQYKPGADRPRIRQQVRRSVVNYINEIPLGETFILNEMIQRIMDTDDHLLDMQIQSFQTGKYNASTGTVTDNTGQTPPSNFSLSSRTEHWYTSDRFMTICDF